MFQERLTRPVTGDKYIQFYNTRNAGGLSQCVPGSPRDKQANVLANCVGYACGRFCEVFSQMANYTGMRYPRLSCNAENFIEKAQSIYGLKVGNVPQVGAIMCWQKGGTLNGSDGAGHVCVVERVNGSSSVVTSESGWNASKPFWTQTRTNSNGRWGQASGYKFRGFIYNGALYENPYNMSARALKLLPVKQKGEDVKWLQWELNKKFNAGLALDGVFGKLTQEALKKAQKEVNVTVDGVCGPATRTAFLQRY